MQAQKQAKHSANQFFPRRSRRMSQTKGLVNHEHRVSKIKTIANNCNPQKMPTTQKLTNSGSIHPPNYYLNSDYRKKYCKTIVDNFFNQQPKKLKKSSFSKNQGKNPTKYFRSLENRYSLSPQKKQVDVCKIDENLPEIIEYKPKQRRIRSAFRKSLTLQEDENISLDLNSPHQSVRPRKKIGNSSSFKKMQEKSFNDTEEDDLTEWLDNNNLDRKITVLQQNSGYLIGYYKHQGKKVKVKRFKMTSLGVELKNRYEKVTSLGKVPTIWQENKRGDCLQTIKFISLREYLFSIKSKENSEDPMLVISPKKPYHNLFLNNCEEIKDIIVCLAKTLLKTKEHLISTQLCLDNIVYVEEKDYRIENWTSSAVKRQISGENMKTKFYLPPLLTDTDGSYIVNPEYISPEIIKSVMINGEVDGTLFELNWESWGLGLIIYQIFMMIPVWMPMKAQILHNHPVTGILYDKNRSLERILMKQQKIPYLINKMIKNKETQYSQSELEILTLMKHMLKIEPQKRPSLTQIISALKY